MVNNRKLLTAKCCFGHLGGTLGNRLFERLMTLGWFEPKADEPKHYDLTQHGIEELIRLGVDPYYRR